MAIVFRIDAQLPFRDLLYPVRRCQRDTFFPLRDRAWSDAQRNCCRINAAEIIEHLRFFHKTYKLIKFVIEKHT